MIQGLMELLNCYHNRLRVTVKIGLDPKCMNIKKNILVLIKLTFKFLIKLCSYQTSGYTYLPP